MTTWVLLALVCLECGMVQGADRPRGLEQSWVQACLLRLPSPSPAYNAYRFTTIIPAVARGQRMMVLAAPEDGRFCPLAPTRLVAWDLAGKDRVVALLALKPPEGEEGGVPSSLGGALERWGMWWRVDPIGPPMQGQPVAVTWLGKVGAAVVAINETVRRYARPSSEFDSRVPCGEASLYLLKPHTQPRTIGRCNGLIQLADAGDGRHVFTLELCDITGRRRESGHVVMTRATVTGLCVRDIWTGRRRELIRPVARDYLMVHRGRASVASQAPHRRWDAQNKRWRYSWSDPLTHERLDRPPAGVSGLLAVSVDGRVEPELVVEPPKYLVAASIGQRGLLALVDQGDTRPRVAILSRRLASRAGRGRSEIRLAKIVSQYGRNWPAGNVDTWVAQPDPESGGEALVIVRAVPKYDPAAYFVRRTWPRVMLVSAGSYHLPPKVGRVTVTGPTLGPVEATVVGRLPLTEVRPWNLVAVSGKYSKPNPAWMWKHGRPLQVRLALPMHVGRRRLMLLGKRVYQLSTASALPMIPVSVEQGSRPGVALVLKPVQPIDLSKLVVGS